MARVDIGGERGSYSDGAVGAWAAKAVSTIGTVSRDVVGPYDGQRAKDWGAEGVPADIKAKAGRPQGQDDLAGHDLRGAGGRPGQRLPRHRLLEPGVHPRARRRRVLPARGDLGPLHADRRRPGRRAAGRLHLPVVGERRPVRPARPRPAAELVLGRPRRRRRDARACRTRGPSRASTGYPGQALPDHWTYDGFA